MEYPKNPTPEEMQKLLEKAQRDLEEALSKLSPEERKKAEERAQAMIEEDRKAKQALVEEAAQFAKATAKKPKFCSECGAPIEGGKFCAYCGSPIIGA